MRQGRHCDSSSFSQGHACRVRLLFISLQPDELTTSRFRKSVFSVTRLNASMSRVRTPYSWLLCIFRTSVTTLFLILAGKFLLESLGGDGDGMLFTVCETCMQLREISQKYSPSNELAYNGQTVDAARFTKLWTGVAGIIVWVPVREHEWHP